jgi:putative transcriptional regulator
MSRIANRIRERRAAHPGMTQEALAERVSVTRQTIIALEAGKYAPSLELAFRLAHALRVPITELFTYDPG